MYKNFITDVFFTLLQYWCRILSRNHFHELCVQGSMTLPDNDLQFQLCLFISGFHFKKYLGFSSLIFKHLFSVCCKDNLCSCSTPLTTSQFRQSSNTNLMKVFLTKIHHISTSNASQMKKFHIEIISYSYKIA